METSISFRILYQKISIKEDKANQIRTGWNNERYILMQLS